MSVDNAIPELWTGAIWRASSPRYQNWVRTVTDRSSEFTGPGDRIHDNRVSTVPTVKPYTRGADIDAPEKPATDDRVFALNHEKYIHVEVDDVDEAQTRISVMTQFMEAVSRSIEKEISADIKTAWDGVSGLLSYANPTAITAASLATEAGRATAVAMLIDGVVEQMTDWMVAGVRTEDSTAGLYAMVNPAMWRLLMRWLIDQGMTARQVLDPQARQAWLDMVLPSQAMGLTWLPDVTGEDEWAATKILRARLGHVKHMQFARYINTAEPYRPERRFADAVKALMVYGVKAVGPGTEMLRVNFTLT